MRQLVWWSFVLFGALACKATRPLHPEFGRCIWVDRWDYQTAADIERVLEDCRAAGFGTVLFQVRGNGTVAYPSSLEPWSDRFGFEDPGFDPLATALAAAHKRGLRLHAWVNLLPGWSGVDEPAVPSQLWKQHREWFLQDRENRFQPRSAGSYLTLNPCLPEVRRYLADVCRELVTRYDVDGLHLDYVRFPEEASAFEPGTDPLTTNLFNRATGKARDDDEALRGWQTQCVTRLVAEIGAAVRATERRLCLSAAVWADQQAALQKVRQEWPQWCQKRLVDAVMPMDYTGDDRLFAQQARAAVVAARGVPVVVGIGVHKLDGASQCRAQLDLALAAGGSGVGVFGYRALFGEPQQAPVPAQADLRHEVGTWLDAVGKRR